MGAIIAAGKGSPDSRCTSDLIGIGINGQGTGRPKALFRKAWGSRMGLLRWRETEEPAAPIALPNKLPFQVENYILNVKREHRTTMDHRLNQEPGRSGRRGILDSPVIDRRVGVRRHLGRVTVSWEPANETIMYPQVRPRIGRQQTAEHHLLGFPQRDR